MNQRSKQSRKRKNLKKQSHKRKNLKKQSHKRKNLKKRRSFKIVMDLLNDLKFLSSKEITDKTYGELLTFIKLPLQVILDHLMPLITHESFDYKSLRPHGNPLKKDLYGLSFSDIHKDLISLIQTGKLSVRLLKIIDRITKGVKNTAKPLKGMHQKSRRVVIEKDEKKRSLDIPSVDVWLLGVILHTMLLSIEHKMTHDFMCAYRTSKELKTKVDHQSYYAQQICKIAKNCRYLLSVDLKDAFGQLPHKTIRQALKHHGVHPHVIEVIIKAVSIDSVYYGKNKKEYDCVKHRGISQGNPYPYKSS